jgi:hypothetical protein
MCQKYPGPLLTLTLLKWSVKPEAATAVIELLLMGEKKLETC